MQQVSRERKSERMQQGGHQLHYHIMNIININYH